jgi:putative two-component system response regulator
MPNELVDFLRTTRIFEIAPIAILESVAHRLQALSIPAGETIIHRGDHGDCMYIVVSGRVCIHDGDLVVNSMTTGDSFGEMALIDDEPRIASATATESTRLLRVDRETFFDVITSSPAVSRGILQMLTLNMRKNVHELRQNYQTRLRLLEEIQEGQLAMIFALSKVAESRDMVTGQHLERVREYCRLLAQEAAEHPSFKDSIDEKFVELVYHASPLHDIGKISIPDYILLKPGRLTPEEFAIMKNHTYMGAETLRAVRDQYPGNQLVQTGIEIAESHHEWWDGTGYPYGLRDISIPLSARILSVADVYDALTSRRPYKPPMPHEQAKALISEARGRQFDPGLIECFLSQEAAFYTIHQRLSDER